ncbi:MAG: hypothetical protein JOZ78_11560 [Chroococcidiopsidaceae cyanobacterium CP_BM_ER_R8_30]|nr:hypothetical protein [Chroococcidiopsidaceae cyanobacterium CP_BM_ER_R8_30]
MGRKFQIWLQLRVRDDSPEAMLVNYLNSKDTLYPLKDMAMIALRSYWLPLAYRDNSLIALEEKDKVVRDSIYRLKLQMQTFLEMSEKAKEDEFYQSLDLKAEDTISQPEMAARTVAIKKYQLRFQVQVQDDSWETVLLNYLVSEHKPYPFNDMTLTALKGYWLPLAYRDMVLVSQEEKEKVLRDSIDRLKLQEQYLQEILTTNSPEISGNLVPNVIPEVVPELAIVATKDESPDNEEVWDPYKDH